MMDAATVRLGGIAALVLTWTLAAQGAVDPGVATAPRTEFTAPKPGTYQLPVIQSVADAELLDTNGTVQHLDRFTHGKVTLLTFFYTRCADPLGCPFGYVILSQLRARVLADRQLRATVRFVNISLDPVNDTPEVVRRYAGPLSTDSRSEWSFLTARSVPQLLRILDDFGQDVSVATDPQGHFTRVLHHMLKVFLIDARGRVREIYSLAYLQPGVMMSDLRTVLMDIDVYSSVGHCASTRPVGYIAAVHALGRDCVPMTDVFRNGIVRTLKSVATFAGSTGTLLSSSVFPDEATTSKFTSGG